MPEKDLETMRMVLGAATGSMGKAGGAPQFQARYGVPAGRTFFFD